MLHWGICSLNRKHHDRILHIEIRLCTEGFPSGIDLWEGGNLNKMAKKRMKITKSTLWGQNNRGHGGRQANVLDSQEDLLALHFRTRENTGTKFQLKLIT